MIKPKYFEMVYDDEAPGGNADAPDEFYYNNELNLYKLKTLPFSFILDNNIFEDYIMNNMCSPLMSSRLKLIFDKYTKAAPPFKWFSASIQSNNKKCISKYFLMPLAGKPDVLDVAKTRMIYDDYIYGFFSYSKIKDYAFFPQPQDFDGTLVIAEELRNEIIKNDITGISFRKADITF